MPPNDGAPFGFLRLTDQQNDQAGAALSNVAIPAAQGLHVTFEQWQYGEDRPGGGPFPDPLPPADGIAFFLVDGEATLDAPGAFGGSLGYPQKLPDDDPSEDFLPGVNQGYMGIGLDVLGNYFGDWEMRGNGCPLDGQSPAGSGFLIPAPGENMITVRGPGDGIEGYCFLTATFETVTPDPPDVPDQWASTLPGELHGGVVNDPLPDDSEAADTELAPLVRTIDVEITPAPNPEVMVSITFPGGEPQQVLEFAAPQPVPESYKFGFSASTGLFTDVHLIRNVVIESIEPVQSLTLEKSVDQEEPFSVGDDVDYTYTVTNDGQVELEGLEVVDDKIADVACETTTLPPAIQAPANATTCRGTYTVAVADLEDGQVVNVSQAFAADRGVESNTAETVIEIVAPEPTPTPTPCPRPSEPTPTEPPPTPPPPGPSPPGPCPPEIPDTGSHVSGLAAGAAVALAAGAVLATWSRRRS